ncbi:FAD-dependent oxidoreductase [Phenylobacterium sp.]|uniref:FAD-dependent oxidoreductase n=1 Tax=Phenylobacterium sp. TaxID=1871053 RepID=UPI002DE3BCC4|nr:FAD-dependent oxidoreductase [Phenylobacterium sp.]
MARSATSKARRIETRCVIAGGGPAGVMLGYLLARAGVEVVVLEKHADFFRDFRGDTVHPSTLDVLAEIGLLDGFLARNPDRLAEIKVVIEGRELKVADFRRLPTRCKFIALMPQWDFLDLLAEAGRKLPAFTLMLQAEAQGVVEDAGRVVGLKVRTPEGPLEVRADLVVGADGRGSLVRDAAGLKVQDIGVPIDVLWMRLSKQPGDGGPTLGRLRRGRFLVTIDRGDYWQCAYIIRKGGLDTVHARGLEAFKAEVAIAEPSFTARLAELRSWDDVKLLSVKVDRLERWSRPGLICIGDAAHAMSPIGGIGINLAIQDAVAAANHLAAPLREGRLSAADLAAVQARREPPTRITQAAQVFIQDRVIDRFLGRDRPTGVPWPLRLVTAVPFLRRFPARFVGLGARPEHVDPALLRTTPERGRS